MGSCTVAWDEPNAKVSVPFHEPEEFLYLMAVLNSTCLAASIIFYFKAICSCSVGIVLPVYSTFKAIEMRDQNEQRKWLLYWAVYGSFTIVEAFTDKFLYWFPLYYHVKLAFLVWLQLPSNEGAKQLYTNHLRPFLLRHQARLDHILELFHGELAKFISTHQAEIQYAKALLGKILLSVGNILQQPVQGRRVGRGVGTIEGPAEQVENSESEDES